MLKIMCKKTTLIFKNHEICKKYNKKLTYLYMLLGSILSYNQIKNTKTCLETRARLISNKSHRIQYILTLRIVHKNMC